MLRSFTHRAGPVRLGTILHLCWYMIGSLCPPRTWSLQVQSTTSTTSTKQKSLPSSHSVTQRASRSPSRRHQQRFPYYVVQTVFPSSVLEECVAQDLEWGIAVGVRSWCRLRASFVDLVCYSASHGCKECIFCKAGCRNPNKHVLGVCKAWYEQRQAFLDAHGARLASSDTIATAVLTVRPQSDSFAPAVRLCHSIDLAATLFWTSARRDSAE